MLKIQKFLMACFFVFFTLTGWGATQEALLTRLTVSRPVPIETQITFKLNNAVSYKAFTLSNPHRLVVDLHKTQYISSKAQLIHFSDTGITDFRHGIQKGYNLRMVFDLKEAMHFDIESHPVGKDFFVTVTLSPISIHLPSPIKSETSEKSIDQPESHSPPTKDKTSEKIISVITESTEDDVVTQNPVIETPQKFTPVTAENADDEKAAAPKQSAAESVEAAGTSSLPLRKHPFIVVIDAGHGGKDPGAQGPGGTDEKDITIAIARDLQALVCKHPNMKAVLTRKGDYYVGLRQRLMIARKAKGDIFIAIHADAFNEPDAEGASVFALSLHGASSEAALWLAKKENYSELSGIDLNNIQDLDAQVRSVLIDLSQTATIGASLELGQNVIKQLGKITDLHHGMVEQAPFMVLKSPDIPSILVETGFISNPKEEARLKTTAYQEKIAEALMAGIEGYYKKNVQKT